MNDPLHACLRTAEEKGDQFQLLSTAWNPFHEHLNIRWTII